MAKKVSSKKSNVIIEEPLKVMTYKNLNTSDVMSNILNDLEEERLKYEVKSRNIYSDIEYQSLIDGKVKGFEEAIKIVKKYYS